jgi:hypothetical protein
MAVTSPSQGCRPVAYSRRRPEHATLYRLVQQHRETSLTLAREDDWDGCSMPAHVEREFRQSLECGVLAEGFARARCAECGHDVLVAFSCKGRGLCPSCNARRMAETAAHLVEHVFPPLPVRQWPECDQSRRCRSVYATSSRASPGPSAPSCIASCGSARPIFARPARGHPHRHGSGRSALYLVSAPRATATSISTVASSTACLRRAPRGRSGSSRPGTDGCGDGQYRRAGAPPSAALARPHWPARCRGRPRHARVGQRRLLARRLGADRRRRPRRAGAAAALLRAPPVRPRAHRAGQAQQVLFHLPKAPTRWAHGAVAHPAGADRRSGGPDASTTDPPPPPMGAMPATPTRHPHRPRRLRSALATQPVSARRHVPCGPCCSRACSRPGRSPVPTVAPPCASSPSSPRPRRCSGFSTTSASRRSRRRSARHAGHRRGTTRSRMVYPTGTPEHSPSPSTCSTSKCSASRVRRSAAGGAQGPARLPLSTPNSRSATPPAVVATTDFSPTAPPGPCARASAHKLSAHGANCVKGIPDCFCQLGNAAA